MDKTPERERERERELLGNFIEDKGMPIGNITSQIFANIYLNELDRFVKHQLKIKHYFRYADDFVIVHNDQIYLQQLIPIIQNFLQKELYLKLHPQKVSIRKFRQGIDFLGYIILPYHTVLRTKTRRRMMKKLFIKQDMLDSGLIDEQCYNQSLQSYLGILTYCHGYDLGNVVKNNFSRLC